MASILITGCSRGIGLELVKQLLNVSTSKVATVFATARASSTPDSLSDIVRSSHGRVKYVTLDVTDEASISSAVKEVSSHLGSDHGLDILVNNAGINSSMDKISEAKTTELESLFSMNVASVQRVTSMFLPLVGKSQEKKIVNMTSTLGSVSLVPQFATAPQTTYKVSKAGLNMLTALYALELGSQGFTVFAVSPGWLKTELGGSYADLEPEVGAKEVVRIILEATHDKDNGAFRDIYVPGSDLYTGKNPTW